MASPKTTITTREWTLLILGIAIFGGLIVRFFPGLQTGFPPNDGGMFLSMIRDLKTSHYVLPKFTSYNHLQIPYAYPPFGFYLARFISDIFHVPDLDLVRFLPPLANSLSILAFYLFSSELLRSKPLGALASAFYALTPGGFSWYVMGGGLTRSFGSLFLLLAAFSVYRLFKDGKRKFVGLSILFGGLAVLSHPEAIIQTASVCILLWLFFGRTVKSFLCSLIVGVGVLIFTLPWWLTILSYHGPTPFLTAVQTGYYGTPLIKALTEAVFSYDGFLPILPILRLIGVLYGIVRKKYFFIAWIIVPYLVDPRSSPSVVNYPFSMLAALAFAEAIPLAINRIYRGGSTMILGELYKSGIYNGILFLYLIVLFIESGLFGFRLVNTTLRQGELQAMNWTKENTPEDGMFMLITGGQTPEIDPFVEWFPALTDRRSQSTIQGYEWLLGNKFYQRHFDLIELQKCESASCVESWSERTGLDYQYVVIAKHDVNASLVQSFYTNEKYTQIYSTNDADIYLRNK